MRLTAAPPWVAGSASKAKTGSCSWASPSSIRSDLSAAVVTGLAAFRAAATQRHVNAGALGTVHRSMRAGPATCPASLAITLRNNPETPAMRANDGTRQAAEVLIDQLVIHGVRQMFCVPGESYIAALDACHDRDIAVTVCRQESGAAIMAEAQGKATGRPGICFVTRGPGATNAAAGVHIAHQDSTPLILFVGQVAREMREREAFQELDYRAVFGTMAKWA